MRVRASFTIEHAVLLPLFTFLIVTLLVLCFYIHDGIVIKSGIYQNLRKAEQYVLFDDESRQKTLAAYDLQLSTFLKEKTVGVTKIQVQTNVTGTQFVTECRATFGMTCFLGTFGEIHKKVVIVKNAPPDVLRKMKVMEESVMKEK